MSRYYTRWCGAAALVLLLATTAVVRAAAAATGDKAELGAALCSALEAERDTFFAMLEQRDDPVAGARARNAHRMASARVDFLLKAMAGAERQASAAAPKAASSRLQTDETTLNDLLGQTEQVATPDERRRLVAAMVAADERLRNPPDTDPAPNLPTDAEREAHTSALAHVVRWPVIAIAATGRLLAATALAPVHFVGAIGGHGGDSPVLTALRAKRADARRAYRDAERTLARAEKQLDAATRALVRCGDALPRVESELAVAEGARNAALESVSNAFSAAERRRTMALLLQREHRVATLQQQAADRRGEYEIATAAHDQALNRVAVAQQTYDRRHQAYQQAVAAYDAARQGAGQSG